jgi:signal transduction histidine kinase
MNTVGDIRELRNGIGWLIRLRMVAIVGVIVTTYVTVRFLKLSVFAPGLYAVTVFLFLYNLLFAFLLARSQAIRFTRLIANTQIFLDFLSLTVLLHFSGGIGNPFLFYYVFHTIVSAILLTRWEAAIQTLVAIGMFTTLVLLEHFGAVRHWHLEIIPLHCDEMPIYIVSFLFVLVCTLLLALYMTISISEHSRRKNIEISAIREQLTRHELPRREEEILREEKLASLGKMAAGIAHEINNPLTIVLTNVDLAIDDLEPGHPVRDALEIVKEEVIRCREIIGKLMTFSRGEDEGRKLCDAGQVLRDSIALIQNYASLHRIRIDTHIPSGQILCRINQNQIKQVLVNIMMNGIQAMPTGGPLRIDLSEREGQLVEFAVADSGCGIPRSLLTRIFDPFFTTKKMGEGTGLGLAISHRLVEIHHGVIDIESLEGKGTCVTVRLPKGG